MPPPISQQQISGLIGDIYDCAMDADRWLPTLERLASVMGGCNGAITSHTLDVASFQYIWGTPQEWMDLYHSKYCRINPLLTMPWHFDIDDPLSLDRVMPPDEVRATQFYREFLQPLKWLDFLAAVLEKSATSASVISFARYETDGPPTPAEKSVLELLAPHIRRSVIFHGVKVRDAARATDLAATFNLLRMPIMLLDNDGRCIETNSAADRFLADTGEADGDRALSRLGSLNAAASSPDAITTQPMSSALTLPDGRRFAAHVLPLTLGLRDHMGAAPRATSAVFIQQIGDLHPLPGEVLVKLYGLTPAETRLLVLLCQDFSLEDAAATLGIALPTARTHLQRVFQKTNTNRQSQVVQLVLSALPRPPD